MGDANKMSQQLSKIARTLTDVRETLFECSRESVKGEEDAWHKAEALFGLAKSVDSLRRQTLSLMNGARVSQGAPMDQLAETQAISPPRRKVSAKSGRKNKEDYPHYKVRGRSLIKTGLGRDEKTEYEHIVPRSEFDKVIAKVAALASSRREFTAEVVQENLDCPMYQTYLVLALLRQMNLLEMPRRGSYQTPVNGFPSSPDSIWDQVQHA